MTSFNSDFVQEQLFLFCHVLMQDFMGNFNFLFFSAMFIYKTVGFSLFVFPPFGSYIHFRLETHTIAKFSQPTHTDFLPAIQPPKAVCLAFNFFQSNQKGVYI